jgi:hypothetical protein
MAEDISRNTIYVLVILTLLISVLGTWTVLTHVQGTPAPVISEAGGENTARVSFSIGKSPAPPQDAATGRVLFEVV